MYLILTVTLGPDELKFEIRNEQTVWFIMIMGFQLVNKIIRLTSTKEI